MRSVHQMLVFSVTDEVRCGGRKRGSKDGKREEGRKEVYERDGEWIKKM